MGDSLWHFPHASLKYAEKLILPKCFFRRSMPDSGAESIAPVILKYILPLKQRIEL